MPARGLQRLPERGAWTVRAVDAQMALQPCLHKLHASPQTSRLRSMRRISAKNTTESEKWLMRNGTCHRLHDPSSCSTGSNMSGQMQDPANAHLPWPWPVLPSVDDEAVAAVPRCHRTGRAPAVASVTQWQ